MTDHINMQTIAAFDSWASTCLPTRTGSPVGPENRADDESKQYMFRTLDCFEYGLIVATCCMCKRRTLSLVSKSDI